MSFIIDAIKNMVPKKSNRSVGAPNQAVIPAPTPSQQQNFGGSTAPQQYQTDMSTGNFVDKPSWDAERYTDPAQMDRNLQQNTAERALSGQPPAQVVKSSGDTGQPLPQPGGLTADILKNQFGFNDPNVINSILSDPNKRAQYERELAGDPGGDTSGGPPPVSDDQIKQSYKDKTGLELDMSSLDAIKAAYDQSGQDIESLLNDIVNRQKESALGMYEATMEVLRGQRDEARSMVETKKQRVREDEQTALERAGKTRDDTKRDITNEKESFEKTTEEQKDKLGQSWRNLSMKAQAIARASGRQDSGFAQAQEGKLLLDLNKGLRELASFSQTAARDFSQAIIDADDFYAEQEKEITTSAQRTIEDTDSWLESMVREIQGKEDIAWAQKLGQINDAINKADTYRVQIQKEANDRKAELDTWLFQTMTNFDLSLKQADYQAKLASAKSATQSAYDQMKMIKQGLDTGLLGMREVTVPVTDANNTMTMLTLNPETGRYEPATQQVGQIYGSLPGVGQVEQNVPIESVERYNKKSSSDLLNSLLADSIGQ